MSLPPSGEENFNLLLFWNSSLTASYSHFTLSHILSCLIFEGSPVPASVCSWMVSFLGTGAGFSTYLGVPGGPSPGLLTLQAQ
jgi:hypothetical protein